MKFRHLISRLYRNSDPDADSGGGGFVEGSTVDASVDTGTVDTNAQAGTEAADPAGTMLEAMFGQKAPATAAEQAEAAATGVTVQQLRDEKGRFAGKAAEGQPDPLKKPETTPEDLTVMPEGLTAKAQVRFQALANSNKELSTKLEQSEPIVQSALALQETFKENGVKREQFDQAMQVVGLMNRGDLRGALQAIDEQRALIAMALGEPIPGADPLAKFADLREAVDNLQITEQHAIEIARGRTISAGQHQHNQRQQQVQQEQERRQEQETQQQQAVGQGQQAVDQFCKARMADDMDYARIEPMLLEQVKGGLLEGIPPQRWSAIVEKTYRLIKQTAAQTRGAGATTTVLRPTGGERVTAKPGTMHEAMWGQSKPAGM